MLTHDGERVREDAGVQPWVRGPQACWEERDGGSGHMSVDGETEILSLLLGFLTFPIQYSLLRVFIWDNTWANPLGISVSLLILTFCF